MINHTEYDQALNMVPNLEETQHILYNSMCFNITKPHNTCETETTKPRMIKNNHLSIFLSESGSWTTFSRRQIALLLAVPIMEM